MGIMLWCSGWPLWILEAIMNEEHRRKMSVSPLWLQVSIVTFLFGFAVLGLLAAYIYTQGPPVPDKVLRNDGTVLFTGKDIMTGQHLFEKYGLMQFGTIFGHG